MSSLATTFQSPRFQRRLLVLSALVLLAGVIAFAAVKIGNHPEAAPVDRQGVGVKDVSKVPKTVKLEPAARKAAGDFILTAVPASDDPGCGAARGRRRPRRARARHAERAGRASARGAVRAVADAAA